MSGQITQFLYKRELLEKGMLFRTHVGAATDWDAVQRAMQNRVKWVFVPEVLVKGAEWSVIRPRPTYEDMLAREPIADCLR